VLADGTIDGRVTANTVGGTDYQRPEDMELQTAANGDELLYIATTTTNEVYTFNLTTNTSSVFANQNTIDLATGLAVGAGLISPDNMAIDANGNMYIIEDRNGGVDNDIWFAKDINKDGDLLDAGEGLARWASNGTAGSEFTGLYFDKFDPNVAYVNIQHPTSGNDRLIKITATAPVPEPETYAMLLAGLGLMGATARRRNRKA
jgi:secreted PhoX family phosphatase